MSTMSAIQSPPPYLGVLTPQSKQEPVHVSARYTCYECGEHRFIESLMSPTHDIVLAREKMRWQMHRAHWQAEECSGYPLHSESLAEMRHDNVKAVSMLMQSAQNRYEPSVELQGVDGKYNLLGFTAVRFQDSEGCEDRVQRPNRWREWEARQARQLGLSDMAGRYLAEEELSWAEAYMFLVALETRFGVPVSVFDAEEIVGDIRRRYEDHVKASIASANKAAAQMTTDSLNMAGYPIVSNPTIESIRRTAS